MFDNAGVTYTTQELLNRSWLSVETQPFGSTQPGRGESMEFVFSNDGRLEQMFVDSDEDTSL